MLDVLRKAALYLATLLLAVSLWLPGSARATPLQPLNDATVIADNFDSSAQDLQVVALGEEGFLVAWETASDFLLLSFIVGHRVSASGDPSGDILLFSGGNFRQQPSLTRAPAAEGPDDVVLAWAEASSPENIYRVAGKRLTGEGDTLQEFESAPFEEGNLDSPGIVAAPDGSMGLVYVRDLEGQKDVRYQRFDSAGTALWPATSLKAIPGEPSGNQTAPALAGDPHAPGDTAVVVWVEGANSRAVPGIYAAKVHVATGAVGPPWPVVTGTDRTFSQPQILLGQGASRALVVWQQEGGPGGTPRLTGRLISPDGAPFTPPFEVAPLETPLPPEGLAIAADATGQWVVVWQDGLELFARAFDAGGFPLSDRTPVTSPLPDESRHHGAEPALTFSDDGTFWVAWAQPQGQNNIQILGRLFQIAEDPCIEEDTLCLQGGRFTVEARWRDFQGNTGPGRVVPLLSDQSGLFWFFEADNWEVMVKVLNACAFSNNYWVFTAATTNVEYTLTVTDTLSGEVRSYRNDLGVRAPAVTDTTAFSTCP